MRGAHREKRRVSSLRAERGPIEEGFTEGEKLEQGGENRELLEEAQRVKPQQPVCQCKACSGSSRALMPFSHAWAYSLT